MTKGNGVTHFTELHRTLHKNFLIWRWPSKFSLDFSEENAIIILVSALADAREGVVSKWS